MNEGKSNLFSNGVPESLMNSIEEATGMKRGRATLIKAVFHSLHTYWARIFNLPKTVLNKIDAMCRTFLWHGNEAKERPALVSWDRICKPVKQGGLGFKNLHKWNIASIGKYVWWIEAKADHLWVRWVHAIYLKHQNWHNYNPSPSSSWAWRKICWVKEILKQFLFEASWKATGQQYTSKIGYRWLDEEGMKVVWHPWMSNRMLQPKHTFFIWLVAQNRLLTQDRLLKMHIIQANCCFLCGSEEENIDHLFFNCLFSKRCLNLLAQWLQVIIHENEVIHWWIHLRVRSLLVKHIIAAGVATLMYQIWYYRNYCRIDQVVPRPVIVFQSVRTQVCTRIRCKTEIGMSSIAKKWTDSLIARM
ncbi:uncharacterized protein LOC141649172 [Silene latifolia]|uniref:uncharacterized protein LOC141649172 n=1 Tax=Silene latifolia TaxID=37657 RepID=UPI003D7845C4